MQHEMDHSAEDAVVELPPAPLDHSAVLHELCARLGTDDRRVLRQCCASMCAVVDAQTGCVEGQAESPVLSPATCTRLRDLHTLTLRSMACLRGMIQPGAFFPHLRSLRLHLVGAKANAQLHASAMQA
jgi:hypothetical protein